MFRPGDPLSRVIEAVTTVMITALMAQVFLALVPVPVPLWLTDLGLPDATWGMAAVTLGLHLRNRSLPGHGLRMWLIPLAAVAYAAALAYKVLVSGSGPAPFPSLAEIGFFAFYPLIVAALVAAVRDRVRGAPRVVLLDAVTGGAAGAALAGLAVAPVLHRVWDGSVTALVLLAYPLCGMALVAVSIGIIGGVGLSQGNAFALWALGMVVFGLGDVLFAYRIVFGTFEGRSLLACSWQLGIVLITLGATRIRPAATTAVPRGQSLVVAVAGAILAVLVLTLSSGGTRLVTIVPAVVALSACGLRLVLAFRQVRELAVVREQALTDELTGAANRRALYRAVDELLTEREPRPFAVIVVDLDMFKGVNDSLGHVAGDELLQVISRRLSLVLADRPSHLLARIGGDEFTVVAPGLGSVGAAQGLARELLDCLDEPIIMSAGVVHMCASAGVAMAPQHGTTRADLMYAADSAMYEAKHTGRGVALYEPIEMGSRRRQLEVAEDLISALNRDELVVEYQPQTTTSGVMVAAEALVRWEHPRRGRLGPGEFLDVAERYKLTLPLAVRVLHLALGDLARWRARGSCVRVSVNVSAADLVESTLVDVIAAALARHDVPAQLLTIEVTENAMMRDPDGARDTLRALAALGVGLAVDDYGTGYSSLAYLLRLPIDEIKLDREFLTDLADPRAVEIVRSSVMLTHALGLRMVAEGVEDQPTLEILRGLGCDLLQGWHTGRPMSAGGFEALALGRTQV